MHSTIRGFINRAVKEHKPDQNRIKLLDRFAECLNSEIGQKSEKALPSLVFVCTHNSRRSQFAQVWAHVIQQELRGDESGFEIQSAGTEVTACNPRTIASLERSGFDAAIAKWDKNPVYHCKFTGNAAPIKLWSKTLDDPAIKRPLIAVMVCSHADQNCPIVPGAEARFSLTFNDPKEADDTPGEEQTYDERSAMIAAELHYVFKRVFK